MSIKVKVGLALAVIILIILFAIAMLHRASCQWYGYQTEREVRYALGVGCLVKLPNGWTPRNEIRTEQ